LEARLVKIEVDDERRMKGKEEYSDTIGGDLLKVSHSRGPAWRLAWVSRAKFLGSLGSRYIERQILVQC
jgi:hypothetical protein